MTYFDPSEHDVATPAEAREYMRRLTVMGTPGPMTTLKRVTALLTATDIWHDLDGYRRLEAPGYPDDLPLDKQKLVDRLRFASSLAHPKEDDKNMAATFGTWRYAVGLVESRNCGRLEMLLEAFRTFEAIASETGDEVVARDGLRAFIQAEYSCTIPVPTPSYWKAKGWCAWTVQEGEILPGWLRGVRDRPTAKAAKSPERLAAPKHFSETDYSDDD